MKESTNEAIFNFKKSLELEPKKSETLLNLAIAFMKEKSYDQAIDYLTTCQELDPGQARTQYNLGCCYTESNPEQALMYFEEALRIEPDNAEYLQNTGKFHYLQGNEDKALDLLTRAQQINSRNSDTMKLLGNCAVDYVELIDCR